MATSTPFVGPSECPPELRSNLLAVIRQLEFLTDEQFCAVCDLVDEMAGATCGTLPLRAPDDVPLKLLRLVSHAATLTAAEVTALRVYVDDLAEGRGVVFN